MEKLTNYISKKIISLNDGTLVGYVLNVLFDEGIKNFTGLLVVDDESEKTFLLEKDNIKGVGNDCVMIESPQSLHFTLDENSFSPIGKLVYDSHGNMLGRVIEVLAVGKVVKKIVTDKCEFSPRFVRAAGKDFIIYGRAVKKQITANFAVPENSPTVEISKVNISEQKVSTPYRNIVGTNKLIGKQATCDIFGYNNELIIKKYENITENTIKKAKKHDKLQLLNYFSK